MKSAFVINFVMVDKIHILDFIDDAYQPLSYILTLASI